MLTPGPITTYRYTDHFKATAVRLSELPGVSVADVAESLYSPLSCCLADADWRERAEPQVPALARLGLTWGLAPMAAFRKLMFTTALTWLAIGICVAAAGILFTFPADPMIWQAATWTLVAALCALLVLVVVLGYVMATNQATRTWRRITPFLIGVACLAPVAVGLF
ncbi:hypothetical protein [Luteimonas sp. MC1750]|uniref:hypothetical protein n=1 Tax=Luteimonas sp. MC1750 TaxID=2799326 RepID=UPI0018F0F6E7|nr:hypothetical protein [Luteimonas sp. MC1750]MBJ6985577.1 hypothetical protein [Luteimonas sp. MC1750]QQO05941.1 hypothetical protein JGR68_00290 [Luteimonas sp. MC1750]